MVVGLQLYANVQRPFSLSSPSSSPFKLDEIIHGVNAIDKLKGYEEDDKKKKKTDCWDNIAVSSLPANDHSHTDDTQ